MKSDTLSTDSNATDSFLTYSELKNYLDSLDSEKLILPSLYIDFFLQLSSQLRLINTKRKRTEALIRAICDMFKRIHRLHESRDLEFITQFRTGKPSI